MTDPLHEPMAAITIVVPTYNESLNVPVLYERLAAALGTHGRPFELLVVDDDSPDKTGEVVQALGPNARAIVRKGERGLATAVIRGLAEAKNDLCVVMDADLSHPPDIVHVLACKVEEGGRFAIGSRYTAGGRTQDWSFLRFVNSWGATMLARPLTRVADPMSGFFALRKSTVPFPTLNPVGYKIGLEILVKSGIRDPVEVPIVFTDRLHGTSKMTVKEQALYLQHLLRLYQFRYPTLVELLAFCLVGTTGLLVDLTVLTTAVEAFGASFPVGRVLGFLTAVTTNFFLNDRFTFLPAATHAFHRSRVQRYLTFVGTCSFGMAVNFLVSVGLYKALPYFERYYPLAAIAGVLAGLTFNFVGAKWFVFRKKSTVDR